MKKNTVGIFLAVAMVLPACGDQGSQLALKLDPECWLLRDDLPFPSAKEFALRSEEAGGRYLWVPDVLPQMAQAVPRMHRQPMEIPVPLEVSGTSVALTLDPAARTLNGTAEIHLVAEGGELGSAQFLLSAAGVDLVSASNPAATFSHDGKLLTVTPQTPLAVGQNWTVFVRWHDQDVELEVELFPEGFKKKVLVGYLGEPSTFFTFGYWYWPRLASSPWVSNLDFTVTYPGDRSLLMSGEWQSTADNGDGMATDVWRVDHPAQWHISLALASYQKASGSCGSTTLEVHGMPGESIDGFPIQPVTYVPVLEAICEYYRASFGEPAFGIIRVAGVDERFTNGYASPSLILVPNYTLDDDGSGSFPQRDFYLAHEFAHQWFGNDVLMASPVDAWLTEGLADYTAIGYLKGAWGDEEELRAWLVDASELLRYYRLGGRDHPLVPSGEVNLEPQVYYLKGAWVFRMLEWTIGGENVGRSLRSYRDAHRFVPASTQNFIDAAQSAAGMDLGWFFEEWLQGTGVLSLTTSLRKQGSEVEVGVAQNLTWTTNPLRYYKMPLTLRLEQGGRILERKVDLIGRENTFQLPAP